MAIVTTDITDFQVLAVDYFYDFLQFLNYLQTETIHRTVTGNISLKDIDALSKRFRNGKVLQFQNEEMGWKIRSENECLYLNQIRITAEAMFLLYKRRDQFLISKNGRGFLTNLTPAMQYEQMILWSWHRVSWEYFSPGDVTKILQHNQQTIWNTLLEKGTEWIDFDIFCQAIKRGFHFESRYQNSYNPDHELYLDIRYGLLERNLKLFGLVETEIQTGKTKWDDKLTRFRSTNLGLHLFQAGLKPF